MIMHAGRSRFISMTRYFGTPNEATATRKRWISARVEKVRKILISATVFGKGRILLGGRYQWDIRKQRWYITRRKDQFVVMARLLNYEQQLHGLIRGPWKPAQ